MVGVCVLFFLRTVHIHAGNIIVDGNNCRLLDIENSLLGLASFHRPVYAQLHKLNVSTVKSIYQPTVTLLGCW